MSFDEKWNAEKEKVEKLGINQWEQMVLIAVQHCTLGKKLRTSVVKGVLRCTKYNFLS